MLDSLSELTIIHSMWKLFNDFKDFKEWEVTRFYRNLEKLSEFIEFIENPLIPLTIIAHMHVVENFLIINRDHSGMKLVACGVRINGKEYVQRKYETQEEKEYETLMKKIDNIQEKLMEEVVELRIENKELKRQVNDLKVKVYGNDEGIDKELITEDEEFY